MTDDRYYQDLVLKEFSLQENDKKDGDDSGNECAISPPDAMKNDFQNARRRSLHAWSRWRTTFNGCLVDVVLHGYPKSCISDVPALADMMKNSALQKREPIKNPTVLLSYSSSKDSLSVLAKENFYCYGIPRVKLTPWHDKSRNLAKKMTRIKDKMQDDGFETASGSYEDSAEKNVLGLPEDNPMVTDPCEGEVEWWDIIQCDNKPVTHSVVLQNMIACHDLINENERKCEENGNLWQNNEQSDESSEICKAAMCDNLTKDTETCKKGKEMHKLSSFRLHRTVLV